MNPQEPVIPEPGQPVGPVKDPTDPDQPAEYDALRRSGRRKG